MKINIHENESLSKEELIKLINKFNEKEIKWEIFVSLYYYFFEINESFYSKVKILSEYLMKKKLLNAPLDLSDIKRRYEEALIQIIESFKYKYAKRFGSKN